MSLKKVQAADIIIDLIQLSTISQQSMCGI